MLTDNFYQHSFRYYLWFLIIGSFALTLFLEHVLFASKRVVRALKRLFRKKDYRNKYKNVVKTVVSTGWPNLPVFGPNPVFEHEGNFLTRDDAVAKSPLSSAGAL
eukprot:m.779578 g.779578  ORF g.779578 m.779578 type:complete len:105 (+) comp59133_c0_seq30:3706-4020(+)